MSSLSKFPEDLDEFLPWLKERSEAAWADFKEATFDTYMKAGVGGSSWRIGTKWQLGLEEHEIDAIEAHWGLKFPSDYRQFLSILNAPDRGRYHVGWSDEPPYGMEEGDDQPSYYDWRKDDDAIAYRLNWPSDGLFFDVIENDLWPDSWGKRPKKPEKLLKKFTKILARAPKLIPILGHRFLLADSLEAGNPVLSVWGSDIICYGSNLRNFLLMEFCGILGLDHEEVSAEIDENISLEQIEAIPFWGEIMLQERESGICFGFGQDHALGAGVKHTLPVVATD